MYGKLSIDNISLIDNADIIKLNDIIKNAYSNLVPLQKRYCDEYISCKNEKQAALKAGYNANSIPGQLVRLRRILNICLYVSAKQQLEILENKAQIEAESRNKGADIEISKQACRDIMNDPDASSDTRLRAIDLLAKLNGVYKERPETGKNKAFGIKKPESMSKTEQSSANQSKPRRVSIQPNKPDYSDTDED